MSLIATLQTKTSNYEEKKGERTTELHKLTESLFYFFMVLYVSFSKSTIFCICLVFQFSAFFSISVRNQYSQVKIYFEK